MQVFACQLIHYTLYKSSPAVTITANCFPAWLWTYSRIDVGTLRTITTLYHLGHFVPLNFCHLVPSRKILRTNKNTLCTNRETLCAVCCCERYFVSLQKTPCSILNHRYTVHATAIETSHHFTIILPIFQYVYCLIVPRLKISGCKGKHDPPPCLLKVPFGPLGKFLMFKLFFFSSRFLCNSYGI